MIKRFGLERNWHIKFSNVFRFVSALLKDFEQRPSAKEMLNHEFLDECIAFNLETVRLIFWYIVTRRLK